MFQQILNFIYKAVALYLICSYADMINVHILWPHLYIKVICTINNFLIFSEQRTICRWFIPTSTKIIILQSNWNEGWPRCSVASSARNCDGRRLKTEVGRVPYAFTFRHFARWSSVKEMALVISVYNTKYNFQTAEVLNIVITFYCILYINITMVSVVYISHICTAQFTLQCKYSIGLKFPWYNWSVQVICKAENFIFIVSAWKFMWFS